MKKVYKLEGKPFLPKKSTVHTILNFSKSMEVINVKNRTFIVSKN